VTLSNLAHRHTLHHARAPPHPLASLRHDSHEQDFQQTWKHDSHVFIRLRIASSWESWSHSTSEHPVSWSTMMSAPVSFGGLVIPARRVVPAWLVVHFPSCSSFAFLSFPSSSCSLHLWQKCLPTSHMMQKICQILDIWGFGKGSETYGFLELWCLNWSFASWFRNGSGTRIVLLSPKTNPSVGIAKTSRDNQGTSPLGLLSTIIKEREQSGQESAAHKKIALANEHTWAPMMSTSALGVARTSARCLGHPARAREPLRNVFLCFERKCTFPPLI